MTLTSVSLRCAYICTGWALRRERRPVQSWTSRPNRAPGDDENDALDQDDIIRVRRLDLGMAQLGGE